MTYILIIKYLIKKMNKFYIMASLLGALTSATGVVPEGSASTDYIKAVDTDKIHKDVTEKLTNEVL